MQPANEQAPGTAHRARRAGRSGAGPRLGDAAPLFLLLLAAPAGAVTIHVATDGVDQADCGDVASPCASLAYALDLAAVTGPGDVIELASGTYDHTAEINVNKGGAAGSPLVIRGAGPSTVLDGSAIAIAGADRLLRLYGDFTTISDMTLTMSPGALLRISASGVTARDLVLQETTGGAKPCVGAGNVADVLLERLSIQGCTGYGISLMNDTVVTVRDTEVSGATTNGIYVSNSSDVSLEGVWVHDNGSDGSSAAVRFGSCDRPSVRAGSDGLPSVISGAPGWGINIVDGTDPIIEHTLIFGTVGGIRIGDDATAPRVVLLVDHVTIGEVSGAAQFVNEANRSNVTIQNSVLAFNPDGDILDTGVRRDYNLRFDNGSGNVALDTTEVALDPLFADRAGGDYHLRSTGGRYEESSGWVVDAELSPAIDLADPAAPFDLETMDNGGQANAGAYGNTPQASRTGPGQDAGVTPDAAGPDTATPDAGGPDTATPDASNPDTAAPDFGGLDTAAPDMGGLDTAVPDTAGGQDAAGSDTVSAQDSALSDTLTTPDAGVGLDVAAADARQPDTSVAIDASTVPDAAQSDAVGSVVIARAGPDQTVLAPASVVLDGSASTAPADALYLWDVVDGPQGPGADPIGTSELIAVDLDEPGIHVFQLTVTHGTWADSDLVVITVREQAEVAPDACGCGVTGDAQAPLAALLSIALLGLSLARRRR